jgi:hypothetical protein
MGVYLNNSHNFYFVSHNHIDNSPLFVQVNNNWVHPIRFPVFYGNHYDLWDCEILANKCEAASISKFIAFRQAIQTKGAGVLHHSWNELLDQHPLMDCHSSWQFDDVHDNA